MRLLSLILMTLCVSLPAMAAIENPPYPIVVGQYARNPAANPALPDFIRPHVAPVGMKLVLLKTDGTKEDLALPPGGMSLLDPHVSPDGKWVYYCVLRPGDSAMAYIRRINVETRVDEVVINEGEGVISMGPCLSVDGKKMLYAELKRSGAWRSGDIMSMNRTVVMCLDFETKKTEVLLSGPQHFLHPFRCPNGQIGISWSESHGLHGTTRWAVGYFELDGTGLTSVFAGMDLTNNGWHGACVVPSKRDLSGNAIYRGDLLVADLYYNVNNGGYGTLYCSSLHSRHNTAAGSGKPMAFQPFAPNDMFWLTTFEHPSGDTVSKQVKGFAYGPDGWSVDPAKTAHVGKVSMPSAAPGSMVLASWSGPTPSNTRAGRVQVPSFWGHVVLFDPDQPAGISHPSKFRIVGKPAENEAYLQPQAVVDIKTLFGDVPPVRPSELLKDEPHAYFGTSSMNDAEVRAVNKTMDQFKSDTNYTVQGSSKPGYTDDEMCKIDFYALGKPPAWAESGIDIVTSNRHSIPEFYVGSLFLNQNLEIVDPKGKRDTGWILKLLAKVPYVMKVTNLATQTIIDSQFPHFFQPGEVHTKCNGCHNHANPAHDFALSAAGKAWAASRKIDLDVTQAVPKLHVFETDIKPILLAKCGSCHDAGGASGKHINWSSEGDVRSLTLSRRSYASVLSQRVCSDDPQFRMPKDGPALTTEETDAINRWIDTGTARLLGGTPKTDAWKKTTFSNYSGSRTPRADVPVSAGGVAAVVPEPDPDPEPEPEPTPEPLTKDALLILIDALRKTIAERGVK